MKTEIFETAIKSRNRLRFLYGLNPVELEPYYVSMERNGRKVIYGRMNNSSEVKKFSYSKIANIKVLSSGKFSPIIPIISRAV